MCGGLYKNVSDLVIHERRKINNEGHLLQLKVFKES